MSQPTRTAVLRNFFQGLIWLRLTVFWTPHLSGYIIEPIRYNEDFLWFFRNVQSSQNLPKGWFSKETAVMTNFCQVYRIESMYSGLLTCKSRYLWNQSETMRTLKELSGMFKRAKRAKRNKMVKRLILKDTAVLRHFFKVIGETQIVLDFLHVRVTNGTNERRWGPQRSRQGRQKQPEMLKIANQPKGWFWKKTSVLM